MTATHAAMASLSRPERTQHFVSYAQNFEDVVLWRALKHIEGGFYIDVGAADPEEISVTKAFYDRGWSGINIEPTPGYFRRLVEQRSRDLNLNVAAGAAAGLIVLNQIADTGLSTSDDEVARRHAEAGWESQERTVPTLTLTSVCESTEFTDIHFLKVDVEGAEADVLRGLDLSRFRPWIIVAEATEPLSASRNDDAYEELLLTSRYRKAYFDGLNMFYVAEEHADLAELLAIPPNVFDDYVTAARHRLERLTGEQSRLIETLSQRNAQQEQEHEAAVQRLRQEHDEAVQSLRQESDATAQRLTLYADQLKRRLAASYEESEQHRQTARSLRVELDSASERQDLALGEQQSLVVERDALLAHQDAMRAEREARAAEREAIISERTAYALERNALRAERDGLFARLGELQEAGAQLAREQHRLHAAHDQTAVLLDAVRVSTSWRITRPFRLLGRAAKAGLHRPRA